jgi:hypothetical protein
VVALDGPSKVELHALDGRFPEAAVMRTMGRREGIIDILSCEEVCHFILMSGVLEEILESLCLISRSQEVATSVAENVRRSIPEGDEPLEGGEESGSGEV